MFDLKLLLMYFGIFSKRVIISLVSAILSLVLFTMLALHYLFPNPF